MRSLLLGPLLVLAACSCSDSPVLTPLDTAPPEQLVNDHGKYLDMQVYGEKIAVAYYDVAQTGVGFATARPTPKGNLYWEHEEVDGYANDAGRDVGSRGQYVSMAINEENGLVWLAYHDEGNGSLRVAHRLPHNALWHSVKVDSGTGASPSAGMYTSIALGEDGMPVVAHFDAGKSVLRISRRSLDSTWTTETVWEGEDVVIWDTAANEEATLDAEVGRFVQLIIDGSVEYLAFYDGAAKDLVLLEGFAGAYSDTVVFSAGDVGRFPSMLLEEEQLLIAFQDVGNQDLLLATRPAGGDFDVELVSDGDYHGADAEIFRIDEERLGILFFDGRTNDMALAVGSDGAWEVQTVGGDDAAVGFFNEVAELDGRTFAASYDYTNGNIFVSELFSEDATEEDSGTP